MINELYFFVISMAIAFFVFGIVYVSYLIYEEIKFEKFIDSIDLEEDAKIFREIRENIEKNKE